MKATRILSALPIFFLFSLPAPAQNSPESFAGSWKGVCADGHTFVMVTLRVSGSDVAGSISLANMQGSNGQCATVVDPPSPEHAMKISDAQLNGKVLTFRGSERAQFQMTLTEDGARLKFLETPVEDNPWKLTRSN